MKRSPNTFSLKSSDFTVSHCWDRDFINIHHIYFKFTLKNEDGDYIYKDLPVSLTESEIGTFHPNDVMPFTVNISEEQMEQLDNLDVKNSTLEIDNFEYEEVEK